MMVSALCGDRGGGGGGGSGGFNLLEAKRWYVSQKASSKGGNCLQSGVLP